MGYFSARRSAVLSCAGGRLHHLRRLSLLDLRATNPNRLFLFSGTNGLAVGDDGLQAIVNPTDEVNETADQANDSKTFQPYRWTTYAERLSAAGIDWRVYQEYDNFGDNGLAYFARFRGLDPRFRTLPAGAGAGRRLQPAKRILSWRVFWSRISPPMWRRAGCRKSAGSWRRPRHANIPKPPGFRPGDDGAA